MNPKLILGVTAAALTFGGVSFTSQRIAGGSETAMPFLHPLMIAGNACGQGQDGLAKRRAYFVRAATAYAQALEEPENAAPMLRTNLSKISYAITTRKPEAQSWFDQGLASMFNFNHGDAINAFKRAQAIDPDCAMCFWGEALALGPNINAPMADDAVAPAYAALQKAMALRDKASTKEQAIINALHYRYEPQPSSDRAKLDNAYADAMDDVAKKYPDDDLIAVSAAEANMDTQAWDYWTDGGRTPKGRTARTVSLLEAVIARNPDYAAAIHLYIHATEASNNPYRAMQHADRLAALTPGLGHLIHMPSHTYYRTGHFKQSLEHNIIAVATDESFIDSNDASIMYEFGYYTHNVHFALTSAQMAGAAEEALSMAQKLDAKLPAEMASAAPFVQPIKAAPYYAMVQFADPAKIMALNDPGDEMPFLQAAWRYARGEALVKSGDAQAAMGEAEAISELIAERDFTPLIDGNVPALDVLNIARLTIIARASAAQGDLATAIEAMEEAVALQEAMAYMEPPWWYYPAKQTLAGLVLQDGQNERAEQLFLETLTESPNNAWVLFGLAETYKAQNDKSAAKYANALFKDAWLGGKKTYPSLSQL